VVSRPHGSLDRTTTGESARRAPQLADALAVPGRFELVAPIPRDATGKFNKTALRQHSAQEVDARAPAWRAQERHRSSRRFRDMKPGVGLVND
jgi:acyl-coenzyme A synthetase/AMP-(fatty) acid ligase